MPVIFRKIDARYASLLLLAIVLIHAPRVLQAQSTATADNSMDMSVFGGYLYLNPDYGRSGSGGTVGADLTRYLSGWRFAPSFEVRGNYATTSDVSESTALVGFRVKTDFRGRFHPYADFLVGVGRINFDQPSSPSYTHDGSVVYSYGGGVDIDVHNNFAAKFDFSGQSWNMGPESSAPGARDFTLAPMALVVGVTYRIPFRTHNRQSDLSN
jgi:hypothetical protein